MKQVMTLVLGMVLTAGMVCTSAATTIDFESYNNFQNLDGVNLGGVTLTSPNGSLKVYDNRFGVSYHSATKAVANLYPSPSQDDPLIGVFDSACEYLSLWAGDEGYDVESWSLEIFDAVSGGNSLGFLQTSLWSGSPYRELSFSLGSASIWRFEARHHDSPYGIGFDDLSFGRTSVPDSASTLLLMGVALTGFGVLRRRFAL